MADSGTVADIRGTPGLRQLLCAQASSAALQAYLDSDPALPGTRRVLQRARFETVTGRPLRADWRRTLGNLLDVVVRGVEHAPHPDARATMTEVLSGVAGLFLDADTLAAVYTDDQDGGEAQGSCQ